MKTLVKEEAHRLLEELEVGVAEVISGVGFNEVFQMAWQAWNAGDKINQGFMRF
jgi:hypothetical protein